MPLQRFGIVRDGEPLAAIPLRNAVRTGIAYDDVRVDLGLIAEFEERQAAQFANTPWMQWVEISPLERAAIVAHYRMHYQVSLHSSDAVTKFQEAKRKREEAKAKANRGA